MQNRNGKESPGNIRGGSAFADSNAPRKITELVAEVSQQVKEAFGIQPDLTLETLPLVDAFLKEHIAQLSTATRARTVVGIGAYFGEVARRKLDGRWVVGEEPGNWRIELSRCFLYFYPVGIAGEILTGCETPYADGSFTTLDELHDELSEMLEHAPGLPEGEYFSLSGRLEVLELVTDWLVGREQANSGSSRRYTAQYYRDRIDHE